MALTLSIVTRSAVPIANAYLRVLRLEYDTMSNAMAICLGTYASAQAVLDGKPPIEIQGIDMTTFDRSSPNNAHTQIYNYLKTLDSLAGAADA